MPDILDMQDIFNQKIFPMVKQIWINAEEYDEKNIKARSQMLAKLLIEEVKDFVQDQKEIACVNCERVEEPINYRQAEMEDRD